jgi:CRP-like cAMP-binding protein
LNKLALQSQLSDQELKAIAGLRDEVERLGVGEPLVKLGDVHRSTSLIADGFLARINRPSQERRPITAIYVVGDMPDLYGVYHLVASSRIEALTLATIMRIPRREFRAIMQENPGVSKAMTRYLISDATITAEWVANLNVRDAQAGLAHLFCEMAVRLGRAKGDSCSFYFPVSQAQLSEVTSLSVGHVNRSLMALRHRNLMSLREKHVEIHDWDGLVQLANFDPIYLMPVRPMRIMEPLNISPPARSTRLAT